MANQRLLVKINFYCKILNTKNISKLYNEILIIVKTLNILAVEFEINVSLKLCKKT